MGESGQDYVRAALEKIIERAGEVDVTAAAVVAAVQAYAKQSTSTLARHPSQASDYDTTDIARLGSYVEQCACCRSS